MANAYQYSTGYVRRMTAEWQEAVRRDYNHPCIIAWVPMNESWGVPNLASDPLQTQHLLALYHLTRSLDSTRPVVSNDGWEHAITDLCNIHDYRNAEALARSYTSPESAVAAEPAHRPIYVPGYAYRGEPILITEFGGIAFSGEESGGEGWGYSTVTDADKFLERYGSLVETLLRSSPVQGFCYTQLTDVEQEINGLLTYDRKPKVDPARVREINDKT
jgi:beta-galactosidase/beta-glucuronidase